MTRHTRLHPTTHTADVQTGLLQRRCTCGGAASPLTGECEECRRDATLGLQRRLAIGRRDDPLEHEADRVAARVMQGRHTAPIRETPPRLSRRGAQAAAPDATAPPSVHRTLQRPGEPLPGATRAFFEPRFGHDFGRVRIHHDAAAARSAREVNALAYTVGRNVVFGPGQYAPHHPAGRELIAHELAHVVQQASESAPPVTTATAERGTARAPRHTRPKPRFGITTTTSSRLLQRKVSVKDPKGKIPTPGGAGLKQTNAKTVEDYLATLCPAGKTSVNRGSGELSIPAAFCTRPPAELLGFELPWTTDSPAERSKKPTGCGCLCDLVNSPNLWTIEVDDSSWPHTVFDDTDAANGITAGGSGGKVTTPSPNSPKLWGAATASGKAVDIDPWLVLGHELCGHAWLGNAGKHGPDVATARGEGGHQLTVARENALRKEHGIDLRGTFKDPHCGESYWRDKKAPKKVNWSSFRSVCQAWRDAYNKRNGTSYTITDRIP